MDISSEFFVRAFLAAFFSAVALFYTLRLALSDRTVKHLFIGTFGSSHWVAHITFRVFRILIWGVCVVRLFVPELDRYLLIFASLNVLWLNLIGVALMIFGFALAIYGNFNLGSLWRSGVDPDGPAQLVTVKLYALSRNPIYLGVLCAQIGFFFALPSVFTLICLLVGVTAILNQTIEEENHLRMKFPELYDSYCANVRRWI